MRAIDNATANAAVLRAASRTFDVRAADSFEQFGQRIERSLDRAERDRDSYAIDKIVSEPIERITQRVI